MNIEYNQIHKKFTKVLKHHGNSESYDTEQFARLVFAKLTILFFTQYS